MILLVLFILFIASYLIARLTVGKCTSPVCLVGKTAIITGASKGIGYEIVLNLASRGCRVIMADKEDCDQVRKKVVDLTNNPNILSKTLDLSSLKSVRQFANYINSTERNGIDILINNGGIFAGSNQHTDDGLHELMQTNILSHFLLTHLLIDQVKKCKGRIIFTSAMWAFLHNLTLKNINYPGGHPSTVLGNSDPYGNSYVCSIICADLFARKLDGTGVTVNALHPGMVDSAHFTTAFERLNCNIITVALIMFQVKIWGKTSTEGSQTAVHLAVAKEVENVSGVWFWDCRPFPKPSICHNADFCAKLWKECEQLVGLEDKEKL